MSYPYKTDKDIADIERMHNTAYAEDDQPFLRTQRYSLSPEYDPSDVSAKQRIDLQGALENLAWFQRRKTA